jgi:hypothetical protein
MSTALSTNTNTIDVCACRALDKQAVQNSLVLEQATANAIWLIKRTLSTFHYSQKARRDSWSTTHRRWTPYA